MTTYEGQRKLKIGSLCTGYGGLDLAVEDFFDGEMVWYSEIEKHASTLLEGVYPGVPNLGDLKEIDWRELARKPDLETTYAMYDLYCQGQSLEEVGQAFGVTRQTVYTRFKRQNLDLRQRPKPKPFIEYEGRRYTIGTQGYYRATEGDRALLHRVIYENEVGPIPDGWDIHHIDHDKLNNTVTNFMCLSKADHAALHAAEGGDAYDSQIDVLTAGYP